MHEYAIVQALLARAEAEARARRASAVHRLHVAVGELAGVDPALLSAAYEIFRAPTLCARAALDVRHVPARWECPACAAPVARGAVLACSTCAAPARLAGGDEIVLELIEMEVP